MKNSDDTALAEFRSELGAPPDADARDRMRHAVLNATLHARPADRIRFVVSTRRTVVGSAAALAVAGAVGAAVLAPDRSGRVRPAVQPPPGVVVDADTGAPVILELAAQHAATSDPVSLRAGQFVYLRIDGSYTLTETDFTLRFDSRYETWYDPEGMLAVWIRGEDRNFRPLTEADRAAAARRGRLEQGPYTRNEAVADYQAQKAALAKSGPTILRPTAAFLAGFPTDPDQLLAELRKRAGPPASSREADDTAVFAAIVHVFRTADPIIPPALRAALYRVLVKLSGVERVPGEVTIGGRTGIAVGIKATSVKERLEIVLDAGTFTFIGTRSDPGLPHGSWDVVTASAVVDAVGDTG